MSQNFLLAVQDLTILDKTILSHILGRGASPTTARTLCRKINIVNNSDEADTVTNKLEKAKMLRLYGDDGHVVTKEFRSDEAALAELAKFSPIVSTVKSNKPVKEKAKPQAVIAKEKPETLVKTLADTASTDPKRALLLKQISNVAKKLNQPIMPGIDNLDLKKEALTGLAEIFSAEDTELQSLLLEIDKDLDAIASAA